MYFRRRDPRRVRCYAIFEWWLLLSQHPRCLWISTTFSTELAFRDLRRRSWALPLLSMELSPHVLTPGVSPRVFGVWLEPPSCDGRIHPVLYPTGYAPRLVRRLFRREPAISELDWNFSSSHSSSDSIARLTGSGLHAPFGNASP